MIDLFQPYRIGSLEISNRFMRSATTSAWSDPDGIVCDDVIRYYEQLSMGGVGLIVKGHLYIDARGKAHEGMAGIHDDRVVPRLRELTRAVHRHGGAILAQINHGGYQASLGERMGPSDYQGSEWRARALSSSEVWEVVGRYGEAAVRAVDAGFDGVQIHGAHGYLISEFLSKQANTRSDEWGGSLRKRMRLLEEVYDEIRGRLGANVPIALKMNCDDFSEDGFTVDEALQVAQTMAVLGIDMIEISGGGMGQRPEYRDRAKHKDPSLSEACFAGHCERIRASASQKPIALVNGLRKLETMQEIVDRGIADLISLSRPFIREPDLVRKLFAGQSEAYCTRCDGCHSADVFSKAMLHCALN